MNPLANFQRIGAVSNSHVGADFESVIASYWKQQGIVLMHDFSILVGQSGRAPKARKFDLGSHDPKIIIECKSHKWTIGGNMPSAKMTVWNESMYYFSLAPRGYKKFFCVLTDKRQGRVETLAQYYVRCYQHLILTDVEVWEFDEVSGQGVRAI
jgi:hypothetical protein